MAVCAAGGARPVPGEPAASLLGAHAICRSTASSSTRSRLDFAAGVLRHPVHSPTRRLGPELLMLAASSIVARARRRARLAQGSRPLFSIVSDKVRFAEQSAGSASAPSRSCRRPRRQHRLEGRPGPRIPGRRFGEARSTARVARISSDGLHCRRTSGRRREFRHRISVDRRYIAEQSRTMPCASIQRRITHHLQLITLSNGAWQRCAH